MGLIVKPNTFAAGATIVAAEHNENYDTIYNEFNGSIANANLASNAAIADTKLAQITTANKVATSAIQSGALAITKVTGSSTHLTETTAPTTAASEGALYTKDTSGQPELFFREESSGDEVQITTGGELKGLAFASIYDYGSSASAYSSVLRTDLKLCYGTISVTTSQAITNLPFSSATTYSIVGLMKQSDYVSNDDPICFERNSGSQATLYENSSGSKTISWIAIGY